MSLPTYSPFTKRSINLSKKRVKRLNTRRYLRGNGKQIPLLILSVETLIIHVHKFYGVERERCRHCGDGFSHAALVYEGYCMLSTICIGSCESQDSRSGIHTSIAFGGWMWREGIMSIAFGGWMRREGIMSIAFGGWMWREGM